TYADPRYPPQLRNIASVMNPPLLLFHRGTEFGFENCAAVVGTRVCTFHGRSMARRIGKKFGDMGFTVVSGLARGADVEAHMGALESKSGKTISVLAWFTPIYPDEHSELAKDIERRGARISENYEKDFGSMTPSKFVERNRITSGLSKFIVIIETGEDGGTVRQAELANRQNKPVFVFNPKENERAGKGYSAIIEKNNGIPFADLDELLDKIKEGKLEPERTLSQYSLDRQLTLE
ncbi:MAG: DNA-processing protein DprA, partial [Nitrososphaera sp.]